MASGVGFDWEDLQAIEEVINGLDRALKGSPSLMFVVAVGAVHPGTGEFVHLGEIKLGENAEKQAYAFFPDEVD